MKNKICTKCKIEKPIGMFGFNGKWRRNVCKSCRTKPRVTKKPLVEHNPRYTFKMEEVLWQGAKPLPKPIYCSYKLCKCLIELDGKNHKNTKETDVILKMVGKEKTFYCNQWCAEMDNPPRIDHVCKKCGIALAPYKRIQEVNGKEYHVLSSMYPRYCDEHMPKRKLNYKLNPLDI